jgi:hypothetical protein
VLLPPALQTRYLLRIGHLAEWLQLDDMTVMTVFPDIDGERLIAALGPDWLTQLSKASAPRIRAVCLLTACTYRVRWAAKTELPRQVIDEACADLRLGGPKRVREALLRLPDAFAVPDAKTGLPVQLLNTGQPDCRKAVVNANYRITITRPPRARRSA